MTVEVINEKVVVIDDLEYKHFVVKINNIKFNFFYRSNYINYEYFEQLDKETLKKLSKYTIFYSISYLSTQKVKKLMKSINKDVNNILFINCSFTEQYISNVRFLNHFKVDFERDTSISANILEISKFNYALVDRYNYHFAFKDIVNNIIYLIDVFFNKEKFVKYINAILKSFREYLLDYVYYKINNDLETLKLISNKEKLQKILKVNLNIRIREQEFLNEIVNSIYEETEKIEDKIKVISDEISANIRETIKRELLNERISLIKLIFNEILKIRKDLMDKITIDDNRITINIRVNAKYLQRNNTLYKIVNTEKQEQYYIDTFYIYFEHIFIEDNKIKVNKMYCKAANHINVHNEDKIVCLGDLKNAELHKVINSLQNVYELMNEDNAYRDAEDLYSEDLDEIDEYDYDTEIWVTE